MGFTPKDFPCRINRYIQVLASLKHQTGGVQMVNRVKLAVLLSSFAASTALFAQNTPLAQTPAANAPAKATQIAQGQAAPAAGTAGAQSAGVAASTAGAAATGAGFAVPAAVAVGMTAVGAAAANDGGNNVTPASHH
jgi:hypothetical protein